MKLIDKDTFKNQVVAMTITNNYPTENQLDRVVFLDESNKECFTVYNLVSDN